MNILSNWVGLATALRDVALEAKAVPEPGTTLFLLAIALAVMAIMARRRRRRHGSSKRR
jgi:hypothetical protein